LLRARLHTSSRITAWERDLALRREEEEEEEEGGGGGGMETASDIFMLKSLCFVL
jgi:hypothetical protein